MKQCKACGTELRKDSRNLGDFCSEQCFWGYEDKKDGAEFKVPVAPSVSDEFYFGMIKKKVKEKNVFVISKKTLEPYLSLKAFDNFMVENKFMLVRHDGDLSVIKKSIV